MTNTYLSRIKIHNFRTFGEFEIDVPAAPGLILITGTNGLGKSNFFDAIEWGLTGAIRRFSEYVSKARFKESDYLSRRDAMPDSHEVSLTFSGGSPIVRSASNATPMSSIIAQIARTDRPAINDLGTYLALTHFLGQAAQQRFTSRESSHQWQALKGPSGLDRLEQVRSGLRGQSTLLAFSRRIENEQSTVSEIEKQIVQWQVWHARLEKLLQAARASGILSAEEINQRNALLEADIFTLLKETAPVLSEETLSQRLIRLGDLIAQSIRVSTEHLAKFAVLAGTVSQFAMASESSRKDHPVLVRINSELASAKAEVGSANANFKMLENIAIRQKNVVSQIEYEIANLESVRWDHSRQSELEILLKSLQAELVTLSISLVTQRTALIAADEKVFKVSEINAEVTRLKNVEKHAQAQVNKYAEIRRYEAKVLEKVTVLNVALLARSEADRELVPLVKNHNSLNEQIKLAVATQAETMRHADAIGAAVAAIASHVHYEDTECPVCQTKFTPGYLILIANEAARSSDARLADAAADIERLRTAAMGIKGRMDELQAIIDVPMQLERNLQIDREAVIKNRSLLAFEIGVEVGEDLENIVNSAALTASKLLMEAEASLEQISIEAAVSVEQRVSIDAQLNELTRREEQMSKHAKELQLEQQACSERISARGMAGIQLNHLNYQLQEKRKSREAAHVHMKKLDDQAETARLNLVKLRIQLSRVESDLVEAEAMRTNADETVTQLVHQWAIAGFVGTPSQAALEENLTSERAKVASLRSFNERLQELAQDNQNVLIQEEINEIVVSMRTAGGEEGLTDPGAHIAKLRVKENAARQSLKLTKDTQTAVKTFTESLKERAENYSTRVLEPLNDVINDFNDAMLSTPGESIQFKADHRVNATRFSMSLKYRDQIEASIERTKDLPPQVVLSEGQLAANGFSILCATSTSYPWSRWKALLLDDPLQHNDIIHTAAFVDVMRNMVELQDYQLIMSSHDRGESDFIERKFEAAGLSCSRVFLTAPSRNGVVYEGPVHNTHAAKLLRQGAREMAKVHG